MRHPLKAEKFFTEQEKERIRTATVEAETKTIGEIAVAVVDRSSRYHEAELLGGYLPRRGNIPCCYGPLFPRVLYGLLFPFTFVFFFPLLSPVQEISHAERHVYRTEAAGTGGKREGTQDLLRKKASTRPRHPRAYSFFLSLLERKVWVLADRGIHSRIHQPTLNKFAGMVSRGIREGRAGRSPLRSDKRDGKPSSHLTILREGEHKDQLCDDVICEAGASETDSE